MSGFDLRFMWRPTTTEQAVQFGGALAKNSWVSGVVAGIANPYLGLAFIGGALLESCSSASSSADVVSADIKYPPDNYVKDVPKTEIADASEQKDYFEDSEVRDLYDLREIYDALEIKDSFELLDSTPELIDLSPDKITDAEVDAADFFELSDLTDTSPDETGITDSTPDVIEPEVCNITGASSKFIVMKGFADPEMVLPLSLTEFLAELTPANPPFESVYVSLVVYNLGDAILPEDENGLKLCYHGYGVSTCAADISHELSCDDELAYQYGPVSSLGHYGWETAVNGAWLEVVQQSSQYGLTIYADPLDTESCYSLFNTFACEYL